jgi:hypothetical protein
VVKYDLCVIATADGRALRDGLYEAYASQHAGRGSGQASALIYRRDIRPVLPPPTAGPVIDIGCRQGELVKPMLADGYDAHGVDASLEQVAIATTPDWTRCFHGDYREMLTDRRQIASVTATDLLEHLRKTRCLTPSIVSLRLCSPAEYLLPGCRTQLARWVATSGTGTSRTSRGTPRERQAACHRSEFLLRRRAVMPVGGALRAVPRIDERPQRDHISDLRVAAAPEKLS